MIVEGVGCVAMNELGLEEMALVVYCGCTRWCPVRVRVRVGERLREKRRICC